MNPLNITFQPGPQGARVLLEGEITENTDFSALLQSPERELVFDLSGVKRINSCGVREWINLVNALAKEGRQFSLERCSVPVVNQLNMISNFRGGAPVRSFFAPYYCEACSAEHTRFLELGPAVSQKLEEPFPCPTCGAEMEFDDLPESYLSFVE